jgi:hypothetical protein
VRRDAGADPTLVEIEIDAHHFALVHPNQIIDARRLSSPIKIVLLGVK